jgi:hypothetical protein
VTRDEFLRRAATYGGSRGGSRVAIEQIEIEGDIARIELSRTYTGGGIFGPSSYTTRMPVRLERVGGAWKITLPPEPYLLDALRPVAPAPAASPTAAPSATPRGA